MTGGNDPEQALEIDQECRICLSMSETVVDHEPSVTQRQCGL